MSNPAITVPQGRLRDSANTYELDVVAFAGASNWAMWIGQQQSYFAESGLNLRVRLTKSSVEMAQDLHSGKARVALTAIDNVIAYSAGQGETTLNGPADFFAFMGVDDGLLSIMAQPEIRSVEELRGRTLAVDALTTGYVFVLKELLSRNRIGDHEVFYSAIGTGAERLNALISGGCDATLLNAPLCLAAEHAGKMRLLRAKTHLGAYQGIVGAATRRWALHNAPIIERFIWAFHRSLAWLGNPLNKDAALEILVDRMPAIKSVALQAYDLLVTQEGLRKTLQIDREGTECVIALREKYGEAMNLGSAERYIDDRFRRAALAATFQASLPRL
jgi:ABC-type nitrate/sulfonate/bicarbonate transport system substrate-binding protein